MIDSSVLAEIETAAEKYAMLLTMAQDLGELLEAEKRMHDSITPDVLLELVEVYSVFKSRGGLPE